MQAKQVSPPEKITRESLVDAPDGEYIDRIIDPINRLLSSYQKTVDGAVSFANNLAAEAVEVSVLTKDPWVTPTLHASTQAATHYSSEIPKYMKHPIGLVEVKGYIESKVGALASGTILWTFPTQYRPISDVSYTHTDNAGNANTFVVRSNGELTYYGPGTWSGDAVSLHVVFMSGDSTAVPNGCWPKNIKTRFNNPPLGVIAMAVYDEQPGGEQTTLPGSLGIDWSFTKIGNAPQVKINNIANLPYNRRIRIKLLIIGY